MIPGLQLQGGRIKYRLVRGVVGNCEEFSKLLGGDRKSPSIIRVWRVLASGKGCAHALEEEGGGDTSMGKGYGVPIREEKSARKKEEGWSAPDRTGEKSRVLSFPTGGSWIMEGG